MRRSWAVAADATGGDDQEIVEALVVDDGERRCRSAGRAGRGGFGGDVEMRERSGRNPRPKIRGGVEVGTEAMRRLVLVWVTVDVK